MLFRHLNICWWQQCSAQTTDGPRGHIGMSFDHTAADAGFDLTVAFIFSFVTVITVRVSFFICYCFLLGLGIGLRLGLVP